MTALKQDLGPTEGECFLQSANSATEEGNRHLSGCTIKGHKPAATHTDIRVVDIPIHHISDNGLRMFAHAHGMSEFSQEMKGALGKAASLSKSSRAPVMALVDEMSSSGMVLPTDSEVAS